MCEHEHNAMEVPLARVTVFPYAQRNYVIPTGINHNMPCPVCMKQRAYRPSMETKPVGVFYPCQICRNEGWVTIKITNPILRWLLGL